MDNFWIILIGASIHFFYKHRAKIFGSIIKLNILGLSISNLPVLNLPCLRMEFFIVSAQIDHYRGGENKWFTIKQNFVWNVILLTQLCITVYLIYIYYLSKSNNDDSIWTPLLFSDKK